MTQIKKYSFLFAYIILTLPLIAYGLGGFYLFMPIVIVFIIIPIIDYWFKDPQNPRKDAIPILLNDYFYKYLVMAYVPAQILILCFFMYELSYVNLTWYEWLGLVLSTGVITGGIGITVAHELMHKPTYIQKLFSKILLASVCYGHFFIEHVRGHHVNVATHKDPATARFNESFYSFYPRTLIGSFKSAWKLELKRLSNKKLSIYSWHNQFWWIILAPFFIVLCSSLFLSLSAALFFILQSIVAFSILEVVNYIEHYGLIRKKKDDGRYERVTVKHSWNSNNWLTNIIVFHLQRHSDHHAYPSKPYQVLRHLKESPQLPTGYAGMIPLALIPSLWFKFMNPKVEAYIADSN